jgi:hypothetical protein
VTRLLVASLAAVLIGCGGEDVIEVPETAEEPPAAEPETPRTGRRAADLYGTDGQLLESTETVAGLRLPRGLESIREEERRHVYLTDVPLTKVQRYFGPRLLTGQVDRLGEGAVYRRATPRDAQGGTVHLDVSIIPTVGGTRVDIVELAPVPTKTLPPAEIERQMAEHLKRLD